MTDPDIAALAKGLTKAQREALLRAPFNSRGAGFKAGELMQLNGANRHMPGFKAALLVRHHLQANYSGDYDLTPLGLLVRDYLKENGDR